jgi:hypothetical protein
VDCNFRVSGRRKQPRDRLHQSCLHHISDRLRLDLWIAEYESCFEINEFEPDSAGKVETDVEGIGWLAVEPESRARPPLIYFVDGVRRVDARIILDDESGRIIPERRPRPCSVFIDAE